MECLKGLSELGKGFRSLLEKLEVGVIKPRAINVMNDVCLDLCVHVAGHPCRSAHAS